MEHLHHRIDAIEQRLQQLEAHTQTVERRLRGWSGLTWGFLVLAVLTWALPSGTAQEASQGGGKGLAACRREKCDSGLSRHRAQTILEVSVQHGQLHSLPHRFFGHQVR
jgi:hypothetical protein